MSRCWGVVTHGGAGFCDDGGAGAVGGGAPGVGLGHQFLRHAERARVYVHLIDGLSDDPVGDYRMLNQELYEFSPMLAAKPQVIAVSKLDTTETRELRDVSRGGTAAGASGGGRMRPGQFTYIRRVRRGGGRTAGPSGQHSVGAAQAVGDDDYGWGASDGGAAADGGCGCCGPPAAAADGVLPGMGTCTWWSRSAGAVDGAR